MAVIAERGNWKSRKGDERMAQAYSYEEPYKLGWSANYASPKQICNLRC